jgi:imidazolonepropionase-like amidohydrolase
MKRLVALGFAAGLSVLAFAARPSLDAHSQDAPLVIEHVTVIDVVASRALPEMVVEIRGRKIAAVTPTSRARIPTGATIVDGRGKFLIPGLWDMHIHTSWPPGVDKIFLPMMLANGVLGAREMHAASATDIVAMKHDLAAGARVGPRLFVAGPAVDGPNSYLPGSRVVKSADEARAAVRDLKRDGVDFIKVYSSLPHDLYFAVAAEAKSEGIPFVGHVPYALTAAEASDAGQRSMEHLTEVDVGTSRNEAGIKAEELEAMRQKHGSIPDAVRLRATYDSAKAAALFERFRRNRTWQVPTLAVLHNAGDSTQGGRQVSDSLLAYMPMLLRNFWSSLPPEIDVRLHALYEFHAVLVRELSRARVPLLAGSDCPNAYVYPGFTLHDELGLLVRAGLTPAEALRAATINPARFLELADSLGTVAPGKVADLVLLDANPLDDIANTKRLRAVIQGGRLFDRRALDGLLTAAKALAASTK